MKKRCTLAKHVKWISLLLLACLMGACGTLEIQLEGTDQRQNGTATRARSKQTALPSETAIPSSTLTAMRTATATPSKTPTLRPRPTSLPDSIPHFQTGDTVTITHIEMFNAMNGWAIARDEDYLVDHILTTMDGGYSWRDVSPPESVPEIVNEYTYKEATGFFLDAEQAMIIYNPDQFGAPSVVWNTSSRGLQWETSEPIVTMYQYVQNLYFSDTNHGWLMLVTEGGMGHLWIELYRMRESFGQWDLVIDPYSENSADLHYCCKTGMAFYGAETGLISFGRGPMGGAFINWTKDGGLTWESHLLPRPEGFLEDIGDDNWGYMCESHSPTLYSSQVGKVALECWVNVDRSDISSFIFTTSDGGIHWESERYPGGEILFLDPDLVWALSNDIYQSLDAGQTWTKMSSVNWEGQFSFVDQQLGWAAARDGDEYALVFTEDGGKTWDIVEPVVVQ